MLGVPYFGAPIFVLGIIVYSFVISLAVLIARRKGISKGHTVGSVLVGVGLWGMGITPQKLPIDGEIAMLVAGWLMVAMITGTIVCWRAKSGEELRRPYFEILWLIVPLVFGIVIGWNDHYGMNYYIS